MKLAKRKATIKRNCEMVLNQIRNSDTNRIKLFMNSFINMRILLEEALAESLEREGKSEDEIILALDKLSGRGKWIAEMEAAFGKQEISPEKDNKNNYLARTK